MRVLLFNLLVIFLIACGQGNDSKVNAPVASVEESDVPDSAIDRQTGDSIPTNVQVDSVIYLAFPKDSISVTVKGYVSRKGEPVICMLPVSQGKKLTAHLVAERKSAEIRFSHIDFPDGTADGPFGDSLQYDLKQKGMHKLYIAPNMMASDPVKTDFTLTISVE